MELGGTALGTQTDLAPRHRGTDSLRYVFMFQLVKMGAGSFSPHAGQVDSIPLRGEASAGRSQRCNCPTLGSGLASETSGLYTTGV